MHRLVPVGHQLLVDVVLIEKWNGLEESQEIVCEAGDQLVRSRVGGNAFELRAVDVEPVLDVGSGLFGKGLELC